MFKRLSCLLMSILFLTSACSNISGVNKQQGTTVKSSEKKKDGVVMAANNTAATQELGVYSFLLAANWKQAEWADANIDPNNQVYTPVNSEKDGNQAIKTTMKFKSNYSQGCIDLAFDSSAVEDSKKYKLFTFDVFIESEDINYDINFSPVLFPSGAWTEASEYNTKLVPGKWTKIVFPIDYTKQSKCTLKLYTANAGAENKPVDIYFANPVFVRDAAAEIVFGDIDKHWAKSAIEELSYRGIFEGIKSGAFNPDSNISAGDFIQWCITAKNKLQGKESQSDNSTNMEKAEKMGLIKAGEIQDSSHLLSRGETAGIVAGLIDEAYENDPQLFRTYLKDSESFGQAYSEAILKVYSKGIITAYEGGMFDSNRNVTKAEAAQILLRVVNVKYRMAPEFSKVVKLNSIFSDNMVLQRNSKIPVWGLGLSGDTVTVSFAGQKVSTSVTEGKWKVELEPVKAGGPYEMAVSGKDSVITVKNMLVGEVWISSGQSNMEFRLYQTKNAEEEISAAQYPNIRLFKQSAKASDAPKHDIPDGSWSICDPGNVRDFSSIGYFFGKNINEKLNVPVGLIYASLGGTGIKQWMPLESFNELKYEVNAGGTTSDTGLYNAMIAPLEGFPIAGVLWYQGENDAWKTSGYERDLPAMISGWRRNWKQNDFSFMIVQLPGYGSPDTDGWAFMRELQVKGAAAVKNTAVVTTLDVGEPNDIHPKDKKPVGERLALAARATVYGEKVEYSGPVYTQMEVKGNRIILTFDHYGKGIKLRDGVAKGFTICSKDRSFAIADAKVIAPNKLEIWSDSVAAPVAVRYAWADSPEISLFDSNGLPAGTFRTDSFDY